MTMADRIGVMHQGKLVAGRHSAEIYEQPNSRWIAEFIGEVIIIEGAVSARRCDRQAPLGPVAVGPVADQSRTFRAKRCLAGVAVRPEKIAITRAGDAAQATATQ